MFSLITLHSATDLAPVIPQFRITISLLPGHSPG